MEQSCFWIWGAYVKCCLGAFSETKGSDGKLLASKCINLVQLYRKINNELIVIAA